MKISNKLLQGYENMTLVHYTETEKLPNRVLYEELGNREMRGVLKCNRMIDGKLTQFYSDMENHVGVIAATRLGKTTSYVIPSILSFAKQKKKRSMLIADPKGELYRNTAATLIAEGYNVKLVNFRDYKHSEFWNPLTQIFRKYRAAMETMKEVKLVKTEKGFRNSFFGAVYDDQEMLDFAVESHQKILMDEVGNDIDTIAAMVFPEDSPTKDPYWDNSAREVFKAFMWAMLEDSNKETNPITEDTFSFRTMIDIADSIPFSMRRDFEDGGYFTDRPETSKAFKLINTILAYNADNTRSCIMSVFNAKMAMFKESTMYLITSCNSFELSKISDEPTAIFVNYRDEVKVHYKVIALFIQDAYRSLIEVADAKDNGKLDIPFYFVLDEFGNFPKITDFDTNISACAGRNIFFILILQSYAQLDNVYGKATSEIIRDNLNMHVFMGSNNSDTLEAFSVECGEQTRLSPLSAINGSKETIEKYELERIRVMPKSELSHFEPGECVITEANSGYVLHSDLERYFLVDEMNNLPRSYIREYKSAVNPFDRRYSYKVVFKDDDDDDDLF